MTRSYYRDLGDGRFESTTLTQGTWSPDEQHMAVAAGLTVHALESMPGGEGKRLSRISLDILGMIHQGECEIRTRVVRPGRRIELLEAEWRSQDRATIVARAWRLTTAETTAVVGVEDEPMPSPDSFAASDFMHVWGGNFVSSLEYRPLPEGRPGRGRIWVRADTPLLDGAEVSPLARLMGTVDVANGIAPRIAPNLDPEQAPQGESWSYPNVDLQLHLHRAPSGEWLGLDVRQQIGPDGVGLTSSVLHDLDGPFGRAEQILLVRPGGH